VLRSFLRKEAAPYIGGQQQLAVPTLTSACYTVFWLTTIALKFTFGHFFLITPLVEPLRALWSYQDLRGRVRVRVNLRLRLRARAR